MRRSPARRAKKRQAKRFVLSVGARQCRDKFLHYFPKGFYNPTYIEWERDYKWQAHLRWEGHLGPAAFQRLLSKGKYDEVSALAVAIEARTNLLFSFEKMALRDGLKTTEGARIFARGLYAFLYEDDDRDVAFARWCEAISKLPRRQTRVLTWPVATIFGFIAQPRNHFFLKPKVMQLATKRYGIPFEYQSNPNWPTYKSLLSVASRVKREMASLRPRDMIDIQSFLWVQGSDEYPL